MLHWVLKEVWEKINFPETYRGIKALGKKHGKRFFWVALIWELIEDLLFPYISWRMGVPELIPVFLILHFEPVVYPAFFWGFKMWDRYQGKEPWDPNRPVHSSYWRSALKVAVFQIAIMGWLSQVIPWKPLAIFTALITLFGFIHERIWHDTNYGIAEDDSVQFKRTAGKTGTYLLVTTMNLFPLLRVFEIPSLWKTLLIAQVMNGVMYFLLEKVWAKSLWGIASTEGDVLVGEEVEVVFD
jgi:uncharacterized membrane protein